MRSTFLILLLPLLACYFPVQAIQPLFKYHSSLTGWHRHRHQTASNQKAAATTQSFPPGIKQGTFTQPLDHFDGTTNLTFEQRYWYHTRYYKAPHLRTSARTAQPEPVPIFVLEGGETSGANRLEYLDHGIIDILAKATGGIAVVLEHRYYGTSYPPRSAFGEGHKWTVDELRWLNNRQAEEDSARFVKNLKGAFAGVDEDLSASKTPVISYGGSYAGARAAQLRTGHPKDFWGAIASSAVTAALDEFPQYMYGIARGNNVTSIQAIQAAIVAIDRIIAPDAGNSTTTQRKGVASTKAQHRFLKLVNLEGLSDLTDFAEILMNPLGDYQSVNWDDALSPPMWAGFLRHMASNPDTASFKSLKARAHDLDLSSSLPDEALRLLDYVKNNYIEPCRSEGTDNGADACLAQDWESFREERRLTVGKAWSFQVCTQWGYFITAPPTSRLNEDPTSPMTFLPASGPKLISSLLDLERTSEVCRKGFPDGKHFKMPSKPNFDDVNLRGAFAMEMDRLAFVDGEFDPWREATPHSETFAFGGARPNTLTRPFILIPNATHHWDENGPRPQAGRDGDHTPGHYVFHQSKGQIPFEAHDAELQDAGLAVAGRPDSIPAPDYIQRTHEMLIESVRSWVEDWKKEKGSSGVAQRVLERRR